MTTLFNTDEIRRRTVEAREAVGELTKAQKLADAIHQLHGKSGDAYLLRCRVHEAMHGPLPQPGANEREEGPKLPLGGTVVVIDGDTTVLVWCEPDVCNEVLCTRSDGKHYRILSGGTWRYATDAEIDAFLAGLPR